LQETAKAWKPGESIHRSPNQFYQQFQQDKVRAAAAWLSAIVLLVALNDLLALLTCC